MTDFPTDPQSALDALDKAFKPTRSNPLSPTFSPDVEYQTRLPGWSLNIVRAALAQMRDGTQDAEEIANNVKHEMRRVYPEVMKKSGVEQTMVENIKIEVLRHKPTGEV